MRLFIAINFNDNARRRLVDIRDELCSQFERGNFSAPENLHLTLTFLGEYDSKQTEDAKAALDSVSFDPFDIVFERIGRFKREGGDLWWAGLRESKALSDLRRGITDRLRLAGLSFDAKRFSPHVTLGRRVVTDKVPWDIEPFGEIVRTVELMKSECINGKLTYTAIYYPCTRSKTFAFRRRALACVIVSSSIYSKIEIFSACR